MKMPSVVNIAASASASRASLRSAKRWMRSVQSWMIVRRSMSLSFEPAQQSIAYSLGLFQRRHVTARLDDREAAMRRAGDDVFVLRHRAPAILAPDDHIERADQPRQHG